MPYFVCFLKVPKDVPFSKKHSSPSPLFPKSGCTMPNLKPSLVSGFIWNAHSIVSSLGNAYLSIGLSLLLTHTS